MKIAMTISALAQSFRGAAVLRRTLVTK